MSRRIMPGLLVMLTLCWVAILGAQEKGSAPATVPAAPAPEALTAWEWFEVLALPGPGKARYVDFLVTPDVFDKARVDLGDLRLLDEKNREVPYALRVRRAEDRQEPLPASEFNRVRLDDRSEELSLDLGAEPVRHNEIVVATSGTNFRRRVRLEGSDTGKSWSLIDDNAQIIHIEADKQVLDVRRLHYPLSRYRYLRLRVYPDKGDADDKPSITSVTVYQTTRVPGEEVTQPAALQPREPVRADGGPGSAWIIDLGAAMPCERISFDIDDDEFVRDYRLEVLADEVDPSRRGSAPGSYPKDEPYPDSTRLPAEGMLTSGQWRRRAGGQIQPMDIRFPEVVARRLRLTVTDDRNPPLTITAVRSSATAREVVFAATPEMPQRLRLYFGNPHARPPNYDFARNLPPALDPPPLRVKLELPVEKNPDYRPLPKPWSERWPWLIYVVLSIASLTLLGILGVLARDALRRHDRVEATSGGAV